MCIALLQNGGDPSIRNSEGKTAYDVADPGSTQAVFTGEYMKHQLLEAARSGNEERLMQYLTPLNCNIAASDGRKSTCLHLAAGYNRLKIVQILISMGADAHSRDKGGLTPLHNSSSYGHFEVCELLISHGANVNAVDLWQFSAVSDSKIYFLNDAFSSFNVSLFSVTRSCSKISRRRVFTSPLSRS